MTTSSGTNVSSSRLLTAATPPISAWRGLTRPNWPLNSALQNILENGAPHGDLTGARPDEAQLNAATADFSGDRST